MFPGGAAIREARATVADVSQWYGRERQMNENDVLCNNPKRLVLHLEKRSCRTALRRMVWAHLATIETKEEKANDEGENFDGA